MSFSLVPGPGALLAEKRSTAEGLLSCTSTLPASLPAPAPVPPAEHLYQWADEIIHELTSRGESNPKLVLAEALDIHADRRWLGCVSAQRNTPRHRVIARFAREGMWQEIWSLNWDCVQESAFENVGIKRNGPDGSLHWPTVFESFITGNDAHIAGRSYTVKIIKPHGCVMAIKDARVAKLAGRYPESIALAERFLITKSELDNLDPRLNHNGTQDFIFSTLCHRLASLPLVVAGWSVSEPYLLEYIETHIRALLAANYPLGPDELSIIDLGFNTAGHTRLASYYDKDEHTSHIRVNPPTFSTDDLFLWIQALYAVDQLVSWGLVGDHGTLQGIASAIQQPPDSPFYAINWVDNFLPVWVRLCWRCSLVSGLDRNHAMIDPMDFDMESRDEHIPWTLPLIDRPELRVAAQLLSALHRSSAPEDWDFDRFPGALFKDEHLVLPVPAWSDHMNFLRGLKEHIRVLKQFGTSGIIDMSLLFLVPDPTQTVPDDRKRALKELVAREFALGHLASGGNLGEITLANI